jgi:hypothetical protein
MKEMAQGSSQVTTALADLRVISTDVKSQYGEMTTTVSGLSDSLRRIGESSRERL